MSKGYMKPSNVMLGLLLFVIFVISISSFTSDVFDQAGISYSDTTLQSLQSANQTLEKAEALNEEFSSDVFTEAGVFSVLYKGGKLTYNAMKLVQTSFGILTTTINQLLFGSGLPIDINISTILIAVITTSIIFGMISAISGGGM